ncbi:MAG TPA: non-heme iron oxygenase ferredoxin subunit [Miltoncostaeaceae bacterium]|nr:non-heme iron oxygenase ferredoxin subunit [Miltoncostaeaceae bacterium]
MIDVAAEDAVPAGGTLRVDVEGTPVCLVNVDGRVHAVHDVCTHALESLSGGFVDGDAIECPRHGALFSVVTGEALTPPASRPLPTFRVAVSDGRVLVDPTPSHPHPIHR